MTNGLPPDIDINGISQMQDVHRINANQRLVPAIFTTLREHIDGHTYDAFPPSEVGVVMPISPSFPSPVTRIPPAPLAVAATHFQNRLAVEVDPADVAASLVRPERDFVLVDCRAREVYRKAHLPGAVSLFHAEINAESVQDLPPGLLVTYCWGPACNAATKGAAALAAHGRVVKEMIGGIEYWIREGHPTEGVRPTVPGQEKPSDWGLKA
jgi:rhodanese-related sulfurtransferase